VLAAGGHRVVTLSAREGPIDRSGAAFPARDALVRRLGGIDVLVHLAGIAHRKASPQMLERINVDWPAHLYEAAAEAGVADFVFLSSIKVLGDVSEQPLVESDGYAPRDDYARSKTNAEIRLTALAESAGRPRLVVIRSPLVYGPGVRANFRALLALADWGRRGLPLPLGGARAPRSLIGVRNLCDAVLTATGQEGIIHAADGEDVCVAELLRALEARRLISVPAGIMRAVLDLAGRHALFERLYCPLQVDTGRLRSVLGWTPPFSLGEQLEETAQWFRRSR
jgi:nucleoside-diphosphate-sugar epimerase